MVSGIGSWSFLVACFGIIGVEHLGSATRVLVLLFSVRNSMVQIIEEAWFNFSVMQSYIMPLRLWKPASYLPDFITEHWSIVSS
jgi:hypothetical protein